MRYVDNVPRATSLLFLLALLVGCASQRGPDIRVNSATTVDYSRYATFGFPEQTGTDRGGYSTLVTDYFKAAVRTQMEARGYQYVDENHDLLVTRKIKMLDAGLPSLARHSSLVTRCPNDESAAG
jgi:hypothetical protein